MLRCGQVNINERDPLSVDVEAWLDYFASMKVDAILVNGGGIMAFYPTEIPYHHRSEWLGSRDLFGEFSTAARKRKIRVVARMDCNYAFQEAYQAHPEWFAHNADGTPKRQPECPWLYKTCMFGTYFSDQMPKIYREIAQRYTPDGFYTNGWPGTEELEVCHCSECQKLHHEIGGVPPEAADSSSSVYRKYYAAYMDRISVIWNKWQEIAQEKSSNSVYVGNLGGGIRTVKDIKELSKVAAWFNADNQGRSEHNPIWSCTQQGRVARSVMNGRTVTNVTGAYDTGHPVWRHASKSTEEMKMWMAETAASGMVPWLHWLGGDPEDTRWRSVGQSFIEWLAANEPHFKNERSIANLAVLYPQSTIAFYGSNGSRQRKLNGSAIDPADYLDGLYAALLEGRFLFDMVHQENLSLDVLKPYRALLVPNAAFLSDKECAAIREYVASGGSLLATFETSRYNEWGEPREDFALSDLFGVSAVGAPIGPFGNSYMHIDQPHPALDSYAGTKLLPGAEFRVPLTRINPSAIHLSVIPNYPAFPPEMVFPRVQNTHEPAAVYRQSKGSRVAYFAGDIDRTFWHAGHPDFGSLLTNAVKWLLNGETSPVHVEGQGLVELFAWKTEPGYALHILNYTNPNAYRPFLSQTYAIGPLKVSFTIPDDKKITTVRSLRTPRTLAFKQVGRQIDLEVQTVEDYEVITFV